MNLIELKPTDGDVFHIVEIFHANLLFKSFFVEGNSAM